jgi:phosphoribosylamine--glycine ligase
MERADEYFDVHPGPCVVKADGLAAGKGAVVCEGNASARAAARRMLVDKEFGKAGETILVEERLEGPEVSIFAITDGSTLLTLDACHDYKRAYDGDRGPNTGGMGAVCPTPRLTPEAMAKVEREILIQVVHTLRGQKRPFQGVLFAGLMLTPSGPKVLEFNVRFGDPECQTLLMRFKGDLGKLLLAVAEGKLGELDRSEVVWDPRPAVCVVIASGGYPAMFKRGVPIRGLPEAVKFPDVKVFHAGAKTDGDRIVTSGGRVLGVTALGETLEAARAAAYSAVDAVKFTDHHYRKDIGA